MLEPDPEATRYLDLAEVLGLNEAQIKTTELERLRDDGFSDLADRIYGRGEDTGLGHYDHLVNDTDELRTLVRHLPPGPLRGLGEGAWPEPFCGVCRSLEDKRYLRNRILCALLDWHGTPYREELSRYRAGKRAYERCLKLYQVAREVLAERETESA